MHKTKCETAGYLKTIKNSPNLFVNDSIATNHVMTKKILLEQK